MSNTFDQHNIRAESKKMLLYRGTLGLTVAVIIFTYAFYVPRLKNNQQRFVNQYPFLNPGAALVDKGDLLVNFQTLRDSLIGKYEKRDDYLISLYFEYLPTGANISLNKDEKIWPASLIKIPVAMAAMKKVETGKWKLSNELVILDEDKDSEYGQLYLKPSGTALSIKEFLKETLAHSDNTAHFVLLRNLDGNELEDVYSHLGLDDIIDALKRTPRGAETDNRITAKRYSVFFRSLYNATYLTPEYSQLFLDILKDAPREYLSQGLPADIEFMHKTGIRVDEAVQADAGIFYIPGRPYLLTVMIQRKDKALGINGEAEKIFAGISKEIYDYVAKPR